ncbi:MAG: hypothetical protein KAR05_07260 [Candidatus Omnitrophica bacterium]|nr:hypothetical protein [Candidatus Omnitrophota bacterium]
MRKSGKKIINTVVLIGVFSSGFHFGLSRGAEAIVNTEGEQMETIEGTADFPEDLIVNAIFLPLDIVTGIGEKVAGLLDGVTSRMNKENKNEANK